MPWVQTQLCGSSPKSASHLQVLSVTGPPVVEVQCAYAWKGAGVATDMEDISNSEDLQMLKTRCALPVLISAHSVILSMRTANACFIWSQKLS